MKTTLRRWLGTLSADEIEALVHSAIVDSDVTAYLDGDEVTALVTRQFERLSDAVARASWGKD